jgi:hypothetical protein|tara:strand:+ start:11186 stop:11500 length:315 start_codon:yes stop_codon:yes gene_type:complete
MRIEEWLDNKWDGKGLQDIDLLLEEFPSYMDTYLECFGSNEKAGFQKQDDPEFDSHLWSLKNARKNWDGETKPIIKDAVSGFLEFGFYNPSCATRRSGYLDTPD